MLYDAFALVTGNIEKVLEIQLIQMLKFSQIIEL
jgi:hypothetical protein